MENSLDLKAIILAAGKGTRMKSSTPKVMHEIFGKTLAQRVVNAVLQIPNISETFVIVGHKAETVTEHITGSYPETNISTVLQMPQLGTGDAVFKVYDQLKGFKGTVLITCADTPLLSAETLSNFVKAHKESKAALSVMSAKVENPTNYGRIVRNDKDELQKIVEEKDANSQEKAINEINAGVYCIEWDQTSPAFFDLTTNNEQGEYYLTDIVDWSVKKGLKAQAFVIENNNEIFGINSREHLAMATKMLIEQKIQTLLDSGVTIIDPSNTWISPETQIGKDSTVYPGCYLDGQNSFGENNIIGPNTFIEGNVKTGNNVKITQSKLSDSTIADNCSVGPFAHLRNGVCIENNVRIGNFVEIKKSEIDNSTNVAHLSYVGDSKLGKNVNIGAGTITANYNALTKEKSKTTIEDEVKIGSNTVLVAPITVSKGANIAAGSVITKNVPEYALALTRSAQKVFENWVSKKLGLQKNKTKELIK